MLLVSFNYLLPAEFIIMQNTDHFRRFCAKNNIELVWWNANTRCKNKTKLGHFYEISGLKILLSPLNLQWVFIVLQRILQKKSSSFTNQFWIFPRFPLCPSMCAQIFCLLGTPIDAKAQRGLFQWPQASLVSKGLNYEVALIECIA